MSEKVRMNVNISNRHSWLNELSNKNLIVDYLLDKAFGAEVGDTEEDKREILGKKYLKAQDILKQIKQE